ncbi:MAG: metalloregulator ArsR/SmtB family transcription factor [Dehalococcoidia bacterium]|nr:metalloregulator ArsR/SmtB family transcription factor [Dehalococcoidia bacterium]
MRNNAYDYLRRPLRIFKALSDETRLRILGVLLVRECCVCEVMQALEISQTRASRNLGILLDAGLLKQRRDGRWTLYRIDREGLEERLPGLLSAMAAVLEEQETVVADRRRLEKSARVGPGCVNRLSDLQRLRRSR